MIYYNCNNLDGLAIDGMDEGAEAFNNDFCTWEMVTGDHGTMVRAVNIKYDVDGWRPEDHLEHWFYDNEVPRCTDCGNRNCAVHPNGWNMCSSLMTGTVSKNKKKLEKNYY